MKTITTTRAYYSLRDLAAMTGMHISTLNRLTHAAHPARRLRAYKIGGKVLVKIEDWEHYVRAHATGSPGEEEEE